jgi:3-methyladenine DNA glycosylase AlkD
MARYGITAKKVYGISVGDLRKYARDIGQDQALSLALWKTGGYEARLLAAFVGEPERVTASQMNAWAASFENWADCDTVCFALFDQSPLAWAAARRWVTSPGEFVKRGGFALMASLAVHDKSAPDHRFAAFLPLIEKGARDDRNFVKKGVSWALRGIGMRSPPLHKSAMAAARRLAQSSGPSCRWVGNDALRYLTKRKPRRGRLA